MDGKHTPQEVTILAVYPEPEVATVKTGDGTVFGVNLWEIKGYFRDADGFSANRYIPTNADAFP